MNRSEHRKRKWHRQRNGVARKLKKMDNINWGDDWWSWPYFVGIPRWPCVRNILKTLAWPRQVHCLSFWSKFKLLHRSHILWPQCILLWNSPDMQGKDADGTEPATLTAARAKDRPEGKGEEEETETGGTPPPYSLGSLPVGDCCECGSI